MRRLSILLVALTALAAGAADARGWGGRAPHGEHGGRGGFAAPQHPAFQPGPGPGPRGGYPPMEGYPGGGYGRPGMGYPTGPPPMPPPRRGFRRGEFMPPAFTSGQALDPRRYHLRTPPPGYVWYGVGRDAYLVQRASGMILDTAPGVW